jgi:DNA-directed RNA polymerase specialized sigma24 family protein
VTVIGTEEGLDHREKEALLKARLIWLLGEGRRTYAMTEKEATETGRALSDMALDAGEVLCALGRCTRSEQRMLHLWLGRGRMTQGEIARELGVSLSAVRRGLAGALDRMVAQVWEEGRPTTEARRHRRRKESGGAG